MQAKFYEVRGRTGLLNALRREKMAVICFYHQCKKDNDYTARNLSCMMQVASKNNRYRYVGLAFIMMNIAYASEVKELFCMPSVPSLMLSIDGKPLSQNYLCSIESSKQITQFVDHHLGATIDRKHAAKKAFQQEMQLQAIKAWGFYAPYAYQPGWYSCCGYCASS